MTAPRYDHIIALNEEQEKRSTEVRNHFKLTWIEIFLKGVEWYEYIAQKKEIKQEGTIT